MKIDVYPRSLIEYMWQEDRKRFTPIATNPPLCLRCGKQLNRRLMVNTLSRYADVYICKSCGTDEALRAICDQVLPLQKWYAISSGRTIDMLHDNPVLTAICSFSYIFEGPMKQFPCSDLEHPVSEVAYSRSDYNGSRWWTEWFHNTDNPVDPTVAYKIAQFTEALFQLQEFRNLSAMYEYCKASAQSIGDGTEFNLYSETDQFYIWLRLISRFRDYNLYVHYYQK